MSRSSRSEADRLPRVVVTNDDGIESPGLRLLAPALAEAFDVVVAAPLVDMSGSGTGIGAFDPVAGVPIEEVDLGEVKAFTISGPPGLAVMAAALGAFGPPPDLVVSGVNAGINTGHSIIHSGTVGAALTARTFRSKGVAISLAQSDPWRWETGVAVAMAAARWMVADGDRPSVLNVNVPAVPLDEVAGYHWADLDEFGYFRVANADFAGNRLQFEVRSASSGADPSSDTALCADGFVTLTPLMTVEPAPFPAAEAMDLFRT